MKTAEIKKYIKECASNGDDLTPQDFHLYITEKYGNNFTKGQLTGGIAQLVDKGELIRVERGVYRSAHKSKKIERAYGEKDSTVSKSLFIAEIVCCLENTNKELSKVTAKVNALNMSKKEFALLNKIKGLTEELESITRSYQ